MEEIKKNLEGKQVVLSTIYILNNDLDVATIERSESSVPFRLERKFIKMYKKIKKQIEKNKVIEEIKLLCYYDKIGRLHECSTDIILPYVNIEKDKFSLDYDDYLYSRVYFCSRFINQHNLSSTLIIAIANECLSVNSATINEYFECLSTNDNYNILLNTLCHYLEKCNFNVYHNVPPYLPENGTNQFLTPSKEKSQEKTLVKSV